jgi:hypothetical protein
VPEGAQPWSRCLSRRLMRLWVCARTRVCVRTACVCVCAELHRDRWTRRKEQYYGQNLHVLRGLPLRFHVCHRPARVAFSLPGVLRRWLAATSDAAHPFTPREIAAIPAQRVRITWLEMAKTRMYARPPSPRALSSPSTDMCRPCTTRMRTGCPHERRGRRKCASKGPVLPLC